MSERDLSVVVFGASGVTGRQVAAYLERRAAETGDRWAVAGRDPARLEQVLAAIGVSAPETIVADVADPGSLAEMAARTRVVLDLVGPYTIYGTPVIDACVRKGAHYADLTGELPFVRRTIDAFHERAAEAGVKVVQSSGFESLPPDLAVLLAAETARERWGEPLADADVVVSTQQPAGRIGLGDLISGGTMQSMAELVGGAESERMADPAVLIDEAPLAAQVRQVSPIDFSPRIGAGGEVIAPMQPAAYINPPVIMRTMELAAAERDEPPQPFRYREGISIPGGAVSMPARYAVAGALSGVQAGIRAVLRANPSLRARAASFMRRALPSSGFGPSGDRLEDWRWQLVVEARTAGGHHVRVELDADGHPGYLSTARMLGEAGLLLAEEGATPDRGGCLTPAAALGTGSAGRFAAAGLRFTVAS